MIGKEIHNFATSLWPINRSLTGEGVRETLLAIKEHIPDLNIFEVKMEQRLLIGRFLKSGKSMMHG